MLQGITREFILSEIRRCADENGGKPLGRNRFEAATGIARHEYSKHWVRWSDAIAEAGYEPNELQARTDDEALLNSLAMLVRDLGHVPVEAEIRMRRRSDPAFPSHNSFRRLGGKAALIRRLHEHAAAVPELSDVAAICAAALPTEPADHDEPVQSALPTGYVYLAKSGRHCKIGHTNSVGRRMYEVGLLLPERLELVHTIETDDPAGIEAYWHRRFADRHSNGEWFRLTPEDVAAFKRRRSFM